jgi:serine/threonine-protein kinase
MSQQRICANCQHANMPQARFCARCGQPLPAPATAPLPIAAPARRKPPVLLVLVLALLLIGAGLSGLVWALTRPAPAAVGTQPPLTDAATGTPAGGADGAGVAAATVSPVAPNPSVEEPSPAPAATATRLAADVTATALPPPTATAAPQSTVTPTQLPNQRTAQDGMVQLLVPAGDFLMGSAGDLDADEDEQPQRTIFLDAFWVDQTEITNSMYAACVAAGACTTPAQGNSNSRADYYDNPAYADYPVVHVSRQAAAAYCQWAGRRLPTEAEWEKAARGSDGRIVPWGDALGDFRANFCDRSCAFNWAAMAIDDSQQELGPVGSYPQGASPFGALDMVGNAYEWALDEYDAFYYDGMPATNPVNPPASNEAVIRGGSWFDRSAFIRAANRVNVDATLAGDNVGFRCVQDASTAGDTP